MINPSILTIQRRLLRRGKCNSARGGWAVMVVGLVVAIATFRLLILGSYPLSDNTEARYSEIARLMASTADWVTLRLPGGEPFWAKPPLSTWASAAGLAVFGSNEWGARLPVFLMALLVGLITGEWAGSGGGRARQYALGLLWGSSIFFASAGAVMTDMALTLSIALALRGFWLAVSDAPTRHPALAGWLLGSGLGMGLLAKGPIAVVLTIGAIVAYAISGRRALHRTLSVPWFKALALAVLVAMPWYLLAEWRTPGFWNYFFLGEHWRRFTQPGWEGDLYGTAHAQPRGLIWAYLGAGLMPWTVLLPSLLLGRRRALTHAKGGSKQQHDAVQPDNWLLVGWALVPMVLFSVSRNILWTYTLPAVPAIAILASRWLVRDPRRRIVDCLMGVGILTTMILAAVLVTWQSSSGGVRTAKGVLAAVEEAGHSLDEVAYFGQAPYSASFYSNGNAQAVVTLDQLMAWPARAASEGGGHPHMLLVAPETSWLSIEPVFSCHLTLLAKRADYVLLQARPSSEDSCKTPVRRGGE